MANLVEEIRHTARGAAILKEWIGSGGKPVDERHAVLRAAICAQCVLNERGSWWESVKSKIADTIREHMAVKRAMNLETPFDDRLGTCVVCKCNNPLQVWVPIGHVAAHTPPEVTVKFPKQTVCWKHIELTK